MEVSRKKIRFLDFWGSLAEARRTSEQKESTKAVITVSIKFRPRMRGAASRVRGGAESKPSGPNSGPELQGGLVALEPQR